MILYILLLFSMNLEQKYYSWKYLVYVGIYQVGVNWRNESRRAKTHEEQKTKTKTLKRKTRTFLHLNAKCKTGLGIHRLGWFWASFKEAVSFLHWAPVFSSYWTCFKELIIPFGLPACGLLCLWLFGLKKEGGFQSSQEYTFGSSRTKRGLETEQSTQGEITELGGGFP